MRHRVRGYSLYEILMTLTLVAVIVGLGLPSYSGVVARNRQHVEINALFHAIHVALGSGLSACLFLLSLVALPVGMVLAICLGS